MQIIFIYVLNTVTILEFFTRITAYRIKGLHFVWNVSKEASTTVGQLAITHPDSLDEIKFAEFLWFFLFFVFFVFVVVCHRTNACKAFHSQKQRQNEVIGVIKKISILSK